jgi:hypothetical protein
MAKGNPNFKKKVVKPKEEPIQEVKEINDNSVLDAFDNLLGVLKFMEKAKQAISKPYRHYFAIGQQILMWRNRFKKDMR